MLFKVLLSFVPMLAGAAKIPHPPGSPPAVWVQMPNFSVPKFVPTDSEVELMCDYKLHPRASLYSLKWYKGGAQFYQYIPKNPRQHAAYSVAGLQHEQVLGGGDGRAVKLRRLTAAATGEYRCELVAEGPPFHTTQRQANMTVVIVPRDGPKVTRTRNTYQMDDIITLNCTAPLSKPSIELSWTVNGVPITDTSVAVLEHLVNPAGLEKVTSRLQLHVTRRHFESGDMTIVCNARLGDGLYARADSITVTDPSKGWFVSGNLYLTSGCGAVSSPLARWRCPLHLLLFAALYVVANSYEFRALTKPRTPWLFYTT